MSLISDAYNQNPWWIQETPLCLGIGEMAVTQIRSTLLPNPGWHAILIAMSLASSKQHQFLITILWNPALLPRFLSSRNCNSWNDQHFSPEMQPDYVIKIRKSSISDYLFFCAYIFILRWDSYSFAITSSGTSLASVQEYIKY